MSMSQQFIEFATQDFNFLVKDFGFAVTNRDEQWSTILFAKEALVIDIGWYKGEVDVVFRILLENSVFRPYISRDFGLGEVVSRINPNAFKERPLLPRRALTAEDARQFLQYEAMLTQKFCLPILEGDFAVLEWIARERIIQDAIGP
jgi:hypothetical protein